MRRKHIDDTKHALDTSRSMLQFAFPAQRTNGRLRARVKARSRRMVHFETDCFYLSKNFGTLWIAGQAGSASIVKARRPRRISHSPPPRGSPRRVAVATRWATRWTSRPVKRRRGLDRTTSQHGAMMNNKKLEPRIAGSWLRRAGKEIPASTSTNEATRSPVAFLPRVARQGWDPKQIWLERIHQPRSDRARNQP